MTDNVSQGARCCEKPLENKILNSQKVEEYSFFNRMIPVIIVQIIPDANREIYFWFFSASDEGGVTRYTKKGGCCLTATFSLSKAYYPTLALRVWITENRWYYICDMILRFIIKNLTEKLSFTHLTPRKYLWYNRRQGCRAIIDHARPLRRH